MHLFFSQYGFYKVLDLGFHKKKNSYHWRVEFSDVGSINYNDFTNIADSSFAPFSWKCEYCRV